MKPGNILDLKGIKIYFPFLRGKDQVGRSLESEADWLVTYLLVCDVVVIPPREFLRQVNVSPNFSMIARHKLLKALFTQGHIVITSPVPSIRDVRDLIEYYNPDLRPP